MIRKSDDGVEHPDQHAINDWFLYGPQNQQIEPLVRQLAVEHGMRLAEVEDVIVAAPQTKLRALKP